MAQKLGSFLIIGRWNINNSTVAWQLETCELWQQILKGGLGKCKYTLTLQKFILLMPICMIKRIIGTIIYIICILILYKKERMDWKVFWTIYFNFKDEEMREEVVKTYLGRGRKTLILGFNSWFEWLILIQIKARIIIICGFSFKKEMILITIVDFFQTYN